MAMSFEELGRRLEAMEDRGVMGRRYTYRPARQGAPGPMGMPGATGPMGSPGPPADWAELEWRLMPILYRYGLHKDHLRIMIREELERLMDEREKER